MIFYKSKIKTKLQFMECIFWLYKLLLTIRICSSVVNYTVPNFII